MRKNLAAYSQCQVFLNYPFDDAFAGLADAMNFAVIAGGLLPVCAHDLTAPDKPRLEMLIEAIQNCRYSTHDLSRSQGEGQRNFARMNMPVEMGMALFHALHTQRREHRCVFFVSTPQDYKSFASDLAGLDPRVHNGDETALLAGAYDWLRGVVPAALFNSRPTVDVLDKFSDFKARLKGVRGSGKRGRPSHEETRELMYQVCGAEGWWDWRANKAGLDEFPPLPIAYKNVQSAQMRRVRKSQIRKVAPSKITATRTS